MFYFVVVTLYYVHERFLRLKYGCKYWTKMPGVKENNNGNEQTRNKR